MRLDHLLSRDLGACEGRGARTGAPPGSSRGLSGGRTGGRTGTRSPLTLVLLGAWGVPAFFLLLPACVRGVWWGGGGMLSGSGAACPIVSCFCFSPGCLLLLVWWWCGGLWGCGWVGCELYSGREYLCSLWCVFVVCLAPGSCCAVRGVVGVGCGLPVLCVVFMGVRWMPWHQGPMKDVVDCDKPRGAVWRALIRGFPNGGTRRPSWGVTRV